MKSLTTPRFWDLFRRLLPEIRKQAYQAYDQWLRDPFAPGLQFKEVDQKRHLWSARVTRGYRVLGIRKDDEMRWVWIGPHREYEKIIKGR